MAPIWINRLSYDLNRTGLVKRILIHNTSISIIYNTDTIEHYWYIAQRPTSPHYSVIDRHSGTVSTEIPVHHLIETDLLDNKQKYDYVAIGKKAWVNGTTIDRSIATQKFIIEIRKLGYQHKVPQTILDNEFNKFKSKEINTCMYKNCVRLIPSHCNMINRAVISHFIDYSKLDIYGDKILAACDNYRILHRLSKRLAETGNSINSYNIMKLVRRYYGPPLVYSKSYAALFKYLSIKSVYDPYPETGVRAMACALYGIPYYTNPNPIFDAALNDGFAGYIGLDHRYLGNERPHYTIIDNNISHTDAIGFCGISDNICAYVRSANKRDALLLKAPRAIVDCTYGMNMVNCGHYFIW